MNRNNTNTNTNNSNDNELSNAMDVDRIESDNSNDPLTFEERGLMLWNNELSQLNQPAASPLDHQHPLEPQPVQPVQPQLNQPAASPLDHQQPSPAPLDHQPEGGECKDISDDSSFCDGSVGFLPVIP
eukprot:779134_1